MYLLITKYSFKINTLYKPTGTYLSGINYIVGISITIFYHNSTPSHKMST